MPEGRDRDVAVVVGMEEFLTNLCCINTALVV